MRQGGETPFLCLICLISRTNSPTETHQPIPCRKPQRTLILIEPQRFTTEEVSKYMYSYPDKDDKVTLNFTVKNTEPYRGYWEQSENKALSFFEKLLSRAMNNGSLLDLGAGEGRLTIKFAKYFKTVTALEPDQERIARAKKNCASADINNVTFLESQFLDAEISENSFEAILCSHIIQHIPTTGIKPTLEKIHAILKPGGIFALTTNYTKEHNDVFEKQTDIVERIDEATFNLLAENKLGILPIHYFTERNLENLLTDFKVQKKCLFHVGRDILIIGEK